MIRRTAFTVAAVALAALAVVVVVRTVQPQLVPSLAQQAAQLESELRCPDCQGLSVAESHTTAASAISEEVVRQLKAGRTPAQVRDYFVGRYGEWILLEPSSPVWFWIPFILIALGAAGLVAWLRVGRRAVVRAGDEQEPADPDDARQRIRDEVEALDA